MTTKAFHNKTNQNQQRRNAALYYSAVDFRTNGDKLMGRHAASESFLFGFAKHSNQKDFYCYAQNKKQFDDFKERLTSFTSPNTPEFHWISPGNLPRLQEVGCLFVPDPSIARSSWLRRYLPQRSYSLCGITHTISSDSSMDLLSDIFTSPIQPWDALICTSKAVRSSVDHLLESWREYYSSRFGVAIATPQFELPVIPLGIHTQDFTYSDDDKARIKKKWHIELNIPEDAIIVLFVGRLSFHAKAHPGVMYQALERATNASGKRVALVQAGWFANDYIADALKQSAQTLSPSVQHVFVDGRKEDVRKEIWAMADIFTSLSDNIQETFGLTPVEAMAAGLPVVITDWNGYRDSVTHGEEGFLIPTIAPAPGIGKDFAYRYVHGVDNYDLYIGNTTHVVSVDINACSEALTRLLENPILRQEMGNRGKRRTQSMFDWKHIIKRYQELWEELADIRSSQDEVCIVSPSGIVNPGRQDPFSLFKSYPTTTLQSTDVIKLLQVPALEQYKNLRALTIHNFGWVPSEELSVKILDLLTRFNAQPFQELLNHLPEAYHTRAHHTVLWFAKMGLVSIGSHNKRSNF